MAQGISALDPRVAATDKFIQEKNIPPDQVENFLLSMGADPRLASLVFKYRKVREASENASKGPPPTSNVDQDISNQYAQLKQQRMQGLAAMPAPAIAQAPMMGGITGEAMPQQMAGGGIVAFAKGGGTPRVPRVYEVDPEGNVDIGSAGALIPYAEEVVESPSKMAVLRRLAGRGLGALSETFPFKHPLLTAALAGGAYMLGSGDDEKKPQPVAAGAKVEEVPQGMTAEDARLLAGIDAGRPKPEASGAALPAAPKYKRPDLSAFNAAITEAEGRVPKDRKTSYEEELKREEDLGETKAIEARRKELAGQKEKAVTSPEKKFWLAFAQAGFTASAKGARNLWETLSMGGVEGMKAYQAMKDKEADTLEKIADKELQLNSMNAAIKRGAMERGDKRYDETRKELQTLRLQKASQEVAISNAENTNAAANWRTLYTEAGATNRAGIMASRSANKQKLEDQYYADIAAAQRTTDPALKAALLRRAKNTLDAKAELERTESGYQSMEERMRAQRELMNPTGAQGGDGFGNVSAE